MIANEAVYLLNVINPKKVLDFKAGSMSTAAWGSGLCLASGVSLSQTHITKNRKEQN